MINIHDFTVGYNNKVVVRNFDLHVEKGDMLAIIGPNGSGKSTVLKAMGRLLKPMEGTIYLDGKVLSSMSNKNIAKEMACLSQHNTAPKDMSIRKMVGFGRNPHKAWCESLNKEDEEIIDWALENTNLKHMQHRKMTSISGGESQRAWMAMALAQKPKVLLLDEPTTYLDINNQIEILELVKQLNEKLRLTVVMVLHDLNQAAKYSNKIVVLKNGEIQTQGKPEEVLNRDLIRDVYNVDMNILKDQYGEKLIFIPKKIYNI